MQNDVDITFTIPKDKVALLDSILCDIKETLIRQADKQLIQKIIDSL